MAVTISGTLKNASGVRPNTQIRLKALSNTSTTTKGSQDFTITTDANGAYSFNCNNNQYVVHIVQPGFPYEEPGIIAVYPDSTPASLEDFLVLGLPDDLTPAIVQQVLDARDEAQAAAAAALISEQNAAQSESNAAASESASALSESNAATSESNALASANAAAQSESNAADSESNASTSESNAAASAAAASTSEANAANSANAAATSESNAANSEELARRWAEGDTPSGQVPSDTRNAEYFALLAEQKANQIFVNGGLFTPTGGQEYPDVSGVGQDTAYIIDLPRGTDYTYTTGPLTGQLVIPGDIILYDLPTATWSAVEAGLIDALTETQADAIYRRLDTQVPADDVSYDGGTVAGELESSVESSFGVSVWPVSSQKSISVSGTPEGSIPAGTSEVRLNGYRYKLYPEISGTITDINESELSITAGGVSAFLHPTPFNRVINVNSSFTVPSNVTLTVLNGGGFNVASGVSLTLDCKVDADHYQIFFGDGDVTTTYVTTRSGENNLDHVKVCWFGVKSDAQTQATYGTPQDGTNTLGDLPTGTDSTSAFKRAAKLAQTASLHGGKFLEINSPCTLVLPPKGQIKVVGDNWLGNQLFLSELAILDASGDAGNDFKLLPEFNVVRYADYDYEVNFNGCTVYWVVSGQNDKVLGSTVLINRFVARGKGNILPCGTTLVGAGGLIKNKAITQSGFENSNFFNSLSAQEVDWTFGVSGLGVSQTGTDSKNNPADIAFEYDGYSLGDRLRIEGGTYRGLKGIIKSNNPEAVEMNAVGSDFRVYADNSAFFEYSASFSQHKIERCGIFMKGDNQTVFKCRGVISPPPGEINRITRSAQFEIDASRLEGADGLRKTIVDANYGEFHIRGLNTALGMTAENDSSRICVLDDFATATIYGGQLPGRVRLGFKDVDHNTPSLLNNVRSPMLTVENAGMYNTSGIDKFTFNEKDYGFAILQDSIIGKPIPVVRFVNSENSSQRSTTEYADNPMPPCSYYGTFRKPFVIDEFKLSRVATSGAEQGNEYLHNAVTLFPSYCVIEDILLDKNPSTSAFNRIKLTIGTSEFFFDISSPTERKVNLSIINRKISVQTSDEAKRIATVVWVDGLDDPIVGGTPPSHLVIKYRAIENAYEIPANNISGSAVEI